MLRHRWNPSRARCVLHCVNVSSYVLGSDVSEIERLKTQAEVLAQPTLTLLQRAGVAPGARVLDLGAGPGDVSFQVAEIVGPGGSVVGVERDPAQIAVAEHRRKERGLTNVEFRLGDVRTFSDDELYDAVVCRLLLMHLPDAADVLRHQLQHLHPDGTLVAIDYDMGGARALPEVPTYSRLLQWISAGFQFAQADPFVGMRLPVILGQAGLTNVETLGLQAYWPPGDRQPTQYAAAVARTLQDAMVASGAVTTAELDIDTLEQRLWEAAESVNAVLCLPTLVGSWGRLPR